LNATQGIFINASNLATDTHNNTVYNNTIINNTIGLRLKDATMSEVGFNRMFNNSIGIRALRTKNHLIWNNTITNSAGFAIEISDTSSFGNTLFHNEFVNNNGSMMPQASDNGSSNTWNKPGEGNYLNDWTTPDADGDGIVDIPYNLTGSAISQDMFPLTQPTGAPGITTANVLNSYVGEEYNVTYTAKDYDTPPMDFLWTMETNASWLNFSGNQELYGSPIDADLGKYWVHIVVFDGIYKDDTNFTVEVFRQRFNPVIDDSDTPLTWKEDENSFYDFELTNPDIFNDTLTWSYTSDATFLFINSFTGNLTGLPLNEDVGSYWVNVTVNDPWRGNGSVNFTLNIQNVNDDPTIDTPDNKTAVQGESYNNTYNASDVDPTGDILTWSVNTTAGFLDMNEGTGNLSGIPGNDDVGDWNVSVVVEDGNVGIGYSNFTLTVQDTNDPPEVGAPLVNVSFPEDTIYSGFNLTGWFVDMDGDTLAYECLGQANVSVYIYSNLTVELTPAYDWAGIEVLSFKASDSQYSVFSNFTVNVTQVNDAPFDVEITFLEDLYRENSSQMTQGFAKDVDLVYGDKLTYTWFSNVSGRIGQGALRNLSLPEGMHTITLNVSDTSGTWANATRTLEVLEELIGPVVIPDLPPEMDTLTLNPTVVRLVDRNVTVSARVVDVNGDPFSVYADLFSLGLGGKVSLMNGSFGENIFGYRFEVPHTVANGDYDLFIWMEQNNTLVGYKRIRVLEVNFTAQEPVDDDTQDDDVDDDTSGISNNILIIVAVLIFVLILVIIGILLFLRSRKIKEIVGEEEEEVEEEESLPEPAPVGPSDVDQEIFEEALTDLGEESLPGGLYSDLLSGADEPAFEDEIPLMDETEDEDGWGDDLGFDDLELGFDDESVKTQAMPPAALELDKLIDELESDIEMKTEEVGKKVETEKQSKTAQLDDIFDLPKRK